MKKYLGALLAGGMVFALVMGSAAALDFGDVAPLQVGATAPGALECDDSVDISVDFPEHGNEAYPGTGNYNNWRASDGVTVSDINSDCNGAYLTAIAEDANGDEIARGLTTVTAPQTTVEWTTAVDPLLIEQVELHING